MALLLCAALTLALAVYVFYPEKQAAPQRDKPRLDYLFERQAAIDENLRDLRFEHRAGKYRDEEFETERAALEAEAAGVADEIRKLERARTVH